MELTAKYAGYGDNRPHARVTACTTQGDEKEHQSAGEYEERDDQAA